MSEALGLAYDSMAEQSDSTLVTVGHNLHSYDDVLIDRHMPEGNTQQQDAVRIDSQKILLNAYSEAGMDAKYQSDMSKQKQLFEAYTGKNFDAQKAHTAKEDVGVLGEALSAVGKGVKPNLKKTTTRKSADTKNKNRLDKVIKKLIESDPNDKETRNSAKVAVQIMIDYYKSTGMKEDSQIIVDLETIYSFIDNGTLETFGTTEFNYFDKTDLITIPDKMEGKNEYKFEDIVRYMAHEIEHKASFNYIEKQAAMKESEQDASYRYIEKVLARVLKLKLGGKDMFKYKNDVDSFGQTTAARFEYIKQFDGNPTRQMHEFIAIYRTNEKFRAAVNAEVFKSSPSLISRFVKSIKELISSAMSVVAVDLKDINSKDAVNTLNNSMNNIVILANETTNQEEIIDNGTDGSTDAESVGAFASPKDFDTVLKNLPYRGKMPTYFLPYEDRISTFNLLASRYIKNGYADLSKKIADNKTLKKVHKKGMKNSDGVYAKTMETISNRFIPGSFMMRTLTYMNLTGEFNEHNMRMYEAELNNAQQVRNRIDTELLVSMKKEFDGLKYKNSVVKAITRAFDNSLIHELEDTEDGKSKTIIEEILYADDADVVLDEKMRELEAELSAKIEDVLIKEYPGGIRNLARDIARYYDTREVGALGTNDITDSQVFRSLRGDNDLSIKMSRLVALHQFKRLDTKEVSAVRKLMMDGKSKKNDSFRSLMGTSRGNFNLSYKVDEHEDGENQFRFENVTGSHINFKTNYEFKAGTSTQMRALSSDDSFENWIVLREANDELGIYGVYARKRSDFGFVAGLVSSINLNSDGIDIAEKDAKGLNRTDNNIVRTGANGEYQYKIQLSNEMIEQLDINDHPVSSMMKANGHNTQVFNSMSMMKHMLQNETIEIDTPAMAVIFDRDLKSGKMKPYFVNFNFPDSKGNGGLNIDDYPNIKHHYGKSGNTTNVLGFNHRVNMTAKNIVDQVHGYPKSPLVNPSSPVLMKMEAILRMAVTMFSAHVVLGNPAKIANDIAANATILAANNVPVTSAWKYGKEAIRLAPKMTRMRNELTFEQMKLFGMSEDDPKYTKQKKKVDNLEKKIEKDDFYPAIKHGFIQSISTDMLMKDKDNVSELQQNINSVFEAIDSVPGVETVIKKISNTTGYGVEFIMNGIGAIAKNRNQSVEEYVAHIKDKVKSIKEEDGNSAFLSEIIAAPGQSELIRLGGVATLSADVVAKWILYKHTMDMHVEINKANKGKKGFKKITPEESEKMAAALAVGSFINYLTNLPRELDTAKDTGIYMFPQFTLRVQKVIGSLVVNRLFGTSVATATIIASGTFGPSIYGSILPLKSWNHYNPGWNTIFPTEII